MAILCFLHTFDFDFDFRHNSPKEERRKKAALMLFMLVIVFFITNLPVHVLNIFMYVLIHVLLV